MAMPSDRAPNRDTEALSRLRRFVDKTRKVDDRQDAPGLAACKRSAITPAESAYDDDGDGPITTRWAAG